MPRPSPTMVIHTKLKSSLGLLTWLLVCFAASAIGALASIQAKSFYAQLTQPAWAPPASIFGPVWSALFLMMAVSAWLIWNRGGFARQRLALSLFLVQLVINVLWSWLFFAWHQGGLAFLDIVILWVLIGVTLIYFWRVRLAAGILLIPYLLWVSFAAFLNYSVWQLNPALLG